MIDWRKVILKPTDTLQKAIQVLDSEALRIVMVADEVGRLLGTVTDGDIRRALIQHSRMDEPLRNVMFTNPTTASFEDDRESILSMMKNKDLLQVPILDVEGIVVGLKTLHHLLKNRKLDNPVFLMAGGFGKRLRPLTNNVPKPLLKVGNKPVLEIILEQLVEAGFHNFYISTHFKAEMVRQHFGNGSKWGINILYANEEEPLGTAGALGLLPKDLPDLPLLMMNGDLLTKINFEHLLSFHNEKGGIATMCVREYDFQVPYGVIRTNEHRITSIVEKPVHTFFVNAGIYVLESELVKCVSGTTFLDMPHLLEERIQHNEQINSFPVHEYWLDIGQIDQFEQAQSDCLNELL